jgi:hypothetical protein
MAGHGEKLSRKQDLAILALMTEPTQADAARKVGVSPRTMKNWMADPTFQSAYRAARRQLVEQSVAWLQRSMLQAAATLRRNLKCGRPAAEIAAAVAILDRAFKGIDVLDHEERLAELERRSADPSGGKSP